MLASTFDSARTTQDQNDDPNKPAHFEISNLPKGIHPIQLKQIAENTRNIVSVAIDKKGKG